MGDLVRAARDYVSEGLDRHERVVFCRLSPDGIRYGDVSDAADVRWGPMPDLPVTVPLTTDPDWRPSQDPVESLGPMVDAALDDGYTGLRVLTDATDLAHDPVSRAAWVRSEHLIDRYARDHALTILCSYDVEDLGDGPVAEVACVHALTGGTPSPFLLHATGGGGLGLAGEVDRASAPALGRALTQVAAAQVPTPRVLDLTELGFVDHSGLVAMHRAAAALGTRLHLVGASPLVTRLVDVLALDALDLGEVS